MTFLVIFCAVLAAAAAAFCALADGALLALDDDEEPSARPVRELLARREQTHRALAFGRIAAQLLTGAATAAALKVSDVPPEQIAPAVVGLGILVVIIAESAARTAGDALGPAALERLAPAISAVEHLLMPVVFAGAWSDALLQRLLPAPKPDAEDREATLEQFREVVAAEAEVTRDEAVLLKGVFSLGDTEVQAIMIPRVDVVGVDKETSWTEVVERVRGARHSRLVAFDGTLDEVLGILYAKDLLPPLIAGREPEGGWLRLVRPTMFVPGTKSVDAQLRDFRTSHRHIAVVVDEYGGTAGVLTLEDVLEVIVGEIHDENDVTEPEVVREGDDTLRVSPRVTLAELSDLTGQDFRREDVRTVGGLIYELVGRVPRNGEAMVVGQFRLVVERVVRRRVERVRLERLQPVTEGAA